METRDAAQRRSPLTGVERISLPENAKLIFSHPSIKEPLHIRSGANAISWSYELNTQVTPTVGGEVVQILSSFVGPMTIEGTTAGLSTKPSGIRDRKSVRSPNDELVEIRDWFLEYLHSAGSNVRGNRLRDEQAIHFQYPHRGWDFYLQLTRLDGFKFDREQYAAPWSITAEIVSDNALNYFNGLTMSAFTDSITNRKLLQKVGFNDKTNPFINPDITGDASLLARKLGNNFQALVASWADGDFMTFGFGALLDNNTDPRDIDEVYRRLFGSSYLGSLPGYGGTGSGLGSTTYGGPENPTTKSDIVLNIATSFEAVDIPGSLAVAASMVETGGTLNPNTRQDGGDFAMGLFQTFPLGAGGSYHKAELTQAINNKDKPVTQFYPSGMQIADAVKWWTAAKLKYYPNTDLMTANAETQAAFAWSAQRAGDEADYRNKVLARLGPAQKLIDAAVPSNTGSDGNSASSVAGLDYTAALAKVQTLIRAGKLAFDKDNDKNGLLGSGSVVRMDGATVQIDIKVLKFLVWAGERYPTLRVSSMVGTHPMASRPGVVSRHWVGAGLDIGSIRSSNTAHTSSYQVVRDFMLAVNSLQGTEFCPSQLICQGAGVYSANIDNLSMNGGVIAPGFSKTVGDHTDHVHVGF